MDEFITISKYAGMREDLVQAGGGNSSVKLSKDRMVIKASGCQLAEITETDGYALVNPQIIVNCFEEKPFEEITKEVEQEILSRALLDGKRPSIETFLHSITDRVTLHTHPVLVNILAVRADGAGILKRLFPDALIVPYRTPGIDLAVEYFRAHNMSGKQKRDIIFLLNHGLIVSGQSDRDVIHKTEEVLIKIAKELRIDYDIFSGNTLLADILKEEGIWESIVYQVQDRRVYETYERLGKRLWNHVICPDCVVYLGSKTAEIKKGKEREGLRDFYKCNGRPQVILYRDQFYVLEESIKKAKEVECMLAFSGFVLKENTGECISYLDEEEQKFLLGWDAEKYRKDMK